MYKLRASVLIIVIVFGNLTLQVHSSSLSRCGSVFLTVSSYKHTYVEMNWVTATCQANDPRRPDQIVLYDGDPRLGYSIELVRINPRNHNDEYYGTTISFGFPTLIGNWSYETIVADNVTPVPGSHCYPYWIVSLRNEKIIDIQCLAIHPTWMEDNREKVIHLEIGKAFIPGTHNSGAYLKQPFLGAYTVNQDRSIWSQLVFGIRHLDIRIGYHKSSNKFTIHHDLISFGDVEPIFDEIRKFLLLATKEVVILDIHRFPYPEKFTINMHENFVQILRRKFGDIAVPQRMMLTPNGPTFREIWASNKRLIICYNDQNMVNAHRDILWRPVRQYWGDKRKPSDLKSFIGKIISEVHATNIHNMYNNPFWAIMAELTPSGWDVIFHQNTLRQLADRVNPYVTRWFRDEWPDKVNIIATDYFLGNNIINIAIDVNKNKGN